MENIDYASSELIIEVSEKDEIKRKKRIEAYLRFLSIIEERDITPYNISKNTGIATSTLSDWKNGKSMPKRDKIEKIADYLDIDADYIETGKKLEAKVSEHIEFNDMYDKLTEEQQEIILNTMKLFIKENNK